MTDEKQNRSDPAKRRRRRRGPSQGSSSSDRGAGSGRSRGERGRSGQRDSGPSSAAEQGDESAPCEAETDVGSNLDTDQGVPLEECAFAEFELRHELLQGIAGSGYRTPSEIQAKTLPYALEERDVVGQARTGTGKTAAFLVPALQLLTDKPGPRVLVVVPTRELAMQVNSEAERLGHYMGVSALAIYGGDPMKRQLDALEKGVQIIAATPGRLLDHLGRGTLRLADLDMLILDEADRMFDLGFREDIAKIMQKAPTRRQTMLFSATLSEEVLGLAERYMNDPVKIFLAPDKMTVEEVDQTVFAVDQPFKTDLLVEVLKREQPERSIIFTRTKIGADRLAMRLNKRRLPAQELHSGLHQKRRERILADFREGKFQYLIATDVAARGIDIDGVSHVINYDIPENPEDYVHRIGRTARMGASGRAVTFVTGEDGFFLTAIEKLINQEIRPIRYDGVRTQETRAAEKKPEPKGPAYIKTLNGYIRKRTR